MQGMTKRESIAMLLSFLSTCTVFLLEPTKSLILEFGAMRGFLVFAFLPLFYIIWEGIIIVLSEKVINNV